MSIAGQRWLVTGGAGFIGSHVVDALMEQRAEVVVVDLLTYAGSLRNLEQHVGEPTLQFLKVDVAHMADVLMNAKDPDHVLHLAAESDIDRSIRGADVFLRTNILGTLAVLEACMARDVPLTVASTDGVYGSRMAHGSFTEGDPLRPSSPYAASKAAADLLCSAYWTTYGTDVRVVRGTNAYGPRQHPEKGIPTFTLAALERRRVPIYGSGQHQREWLFVRDWAAACIAVAQAGEPGGVYNIGGGVEVTNAELASRICDLAGAPRSLLTAVPDRPGHDLRYGLDWDRLGALGWAPSVGLDEGLEITVRWYRENPAWVADARERLAD